MKTIHTSIERGILTSAYKREIRNSIRSSKRDSLAKFKNMVEHHQNRFQSQTGTILQLGVFAFVFALILF